MHVTRIVMGHAGNMHELQVVEVRHSANFKFPGSVIKAHRLEHKRSFVRLFLFYKNITEFSMSLELLDPALLLARRQISYGGSSGDDVFQCGETESAYY